MRKGQQKILERARLYEIREEYIHLLEREDLTVSQLGRLFSILCDISNKSAYELDPDDAVELAVTARKADMPVVSLLIAEDQPLSEIIGFLKSEDEEFRFFAHSLFACGYSYADVQLAYRRCREKNYLPQQSASQDNAGAMSLFLAFCREYSKLLSSASMKKILEFLEEIPGSFHYRSPASAKDLALCISADIPYETYREFIHEKGFNAGELPGHLAFPQLSEYAQGEIYEYDPEREEVLNALAPYFEKFGKAVTLGCSAIRWKIRRSANSASAEFWRPSEITIYPSGDVKYKWDRGSKFLIFRDAPTHIYKERGRGRDSRITMSTLRDLDDAAGIYGKPFSDFVKSVFSNHPETHVYKDILSHLDNTARGARQGLLPPIPVDQCDGKRTPFDLAAAYYVNGRDINWNKLGLPAGYLFMKARMVVTKESIGILEHAFWDKEFMGTLLADPELHWLRIDGKVDELCLRILEGRCDTSPEYTEDQEFRIRDYVRTCRQSHNKISLRFRSLRKINEAHLDMAVRMDEKYVPKITIPQKSRFRELRRLLPPEFEWITSRRRIVIEGRMQHHCVATYADRVNADQCAIYSFIYAPENTRYTVEFIKGKDGYLVNQMQKKYDRGYSKEALDYVRSFLVEQA